MKRALKAVAIVAVATLGTACSGESDGDAQPVASNSSVVEVPSSEAGTEGLPHSGAPAVANPLPESVLAGDPCADAVTEEQAKELLGDAVTHERADEERLGPGCNWTNSDSGAAFRLNYDTKSRQGLSGDYANSKPKMAIFNELEPIDGFPAVAYKKAEDDLMCTTSVGLSDEYGFVLSVSLGYEGEEAGDDPCDGGRIVAEQIVSNLKAKA